MAKKHKKTDLEILEEDLIQAKKQEKQLARKREYKLAKYYEKKEKLSKLKGKNGKGEKRLGYNEVKRDAKGHILPGQTLISPTQFKPGQPGNPSGRPKKSAIDDLLLDFLTSTISDPTKKKKHGRPRKNIAGQILIKALFSQALAGKKGIAQLLFERVGGKPRQEIDAKVENTTPISPEQRQARIQELLKKMNS